MCVVTFHYVETIMCVWHNSNSTCTLAILLQGPSGWEDVMTPRKLRGECHTEGCNGTFAVSRVIASVIYS